MSTFGFHTSKGQIISEGFFGVLGFSQKRTNGFVVVVKTYCMFVFWKNLRIPKVLSKLFDLYGFIGTIFEFL